MALKSDAARELAGALDGGGKVHHVIDGHDSALALRDDAHEVGLMVVHMLVKVAPAGHNDGYLACSHGLDET